MKKLLLSLVAMFAMTLDTMAGEPTKVLTFPATGGESIGAYNVDWTATVGDDVWSLSCFNANKGQWAYVKCGWKSQATTSKVVSPLVSAAITDFVITVDKTSGVTSAKLEVLNSDSAVVESKDVTMAAGDLDITLTGTPNSIYRLVLENAKASSNGPTQISKIALYEAGQYAADAPIANTPETAYTVAEARKLIEAGKSLSDSVYVKGIVSKNDGIYSDMITYWLSDDGTTTSEQLECYDGYGLNGASFTDSAEVQVGATVIVKGTLTYYASKQIYEFNKGSKMYYYVGPASALSVKDFALSVAVDEEFDDEDGTYKAVLTYTSEGADVHPLASGTVIYTITPKDGGESFTGQIDIDLTTGQRNIYISNLQYSTEYNLTINSVTVEEFNMDTFDTDVLLTITDNLPSVDFTTSVAPLSLSSFELSVADGEKINAEDGTFKVVLTYIAKNGAAHFMAGATAYYTVTSAAGEKIEGSTDIELTSDVRNIYVDGLAHGTQYTLTIDSVVVDELNMDTWESARILEVKEGLPSVTFTTDEATAISQVKAETVKANGKFVANGKVVIVKNNNKYNLNGTAVK